MVLTDCITEVTVEGVGDNISEERGACGGETAEGREVGTLGRGRAVAAARQQQPEKKWWRLQEGCGGKAGGS